MNIGTIGNSMQFHCFIAMTNIEKNSNTLLLEKDVNNLDFKDQSGSWEPLGTQWRVWYHREPPGRHVSHDWSW